MTASVPITKDFDWRALPAAPPAQLHSRGLSLAAVSVALIFFLTYLTMADGPQWAMLAGQVALVIVFTTLAVVDYRSAVAIVLVELAVAGSAGQWTVFPGGVHGRVVLYGIVLLRTGVALLLRWRRERRIRFGEFGLHALLLGIVLPTLWMPLGLLNGNDPRDVFADGNGQLFFAFALALLALIEEGHGAWLRRWTFIAATVTCLFFIAIVVVSAPNLVPLEPNIRILLTDRLGIGNAIGYLPNGAYRLGLASGLYLQVGLAMVTWEILDRPRRWWPWVLFGLFAAAELATYTRGFWLGAAFAIAIVVLLGARSMRGAATFAAGSIAMAAAATVLCAAVGFSLPNYVLARTATVVPDVGVLPSQPPNGPSASADPTPRTVPIPPSKPGVDTSGEVSAAVRVVQAQILIGHIVERPWFGHGFGTIAADYPYGSIFSYELMYLDIAYKTGMVGLALFLSFPVRLIAAAARVRFGSRPPIAGTSPHEAAVPIAIIVSAMVTSATNPYLIAAFGLATILVCLAWLVPARPPDDHARLGAT